jgi:hypothetical protein
MRNRSTELAVGLLLGSVFIGIALYELGVELTSVAPYRLPAAGLLAALGGMANRRTIVVRQPDLRLTGSTHFGQDLVGYTSPAVNVVDPDASH